MLKAVLFSGGTQLSGTFWFFKALFFATIIYCIVQYIIQKCIKPQYEKVVQVAVLIIMIVLGYGCSIKGIHVMNIGSALSMYAVFRFGFIFKNSIEYSDWYLKINMYIKLVISFMILCILNNFGKISIGNNEYINPIFMLVASVSGFVLLYELADLIVKQKLLSRLLTYIGQNTIIIMCLHFLAFKIVSLVQVLVYNSPKEYIASFPVLYKTGVWWIAYTVVGVILPLICSYLFNKVWSKIKSKILKK